MYESTGQDLQMHNFFFLILQLTFNCNVFGCPLFIERGEAVMLTDTDNMFSKVKVLCVEPEQTKPQLPHCFLVRSIMWPSTWLQTRGYAIRQPYTTPKIEVKTVNSLELSNHQKSIHSSHPQVPPASPSHHKAGRDKQQQHTHSFVCT